MADECVGAVRDAGGWCFYDGMKSLTTVSCMLFFLHLVLPPLMVLLER